jgi:xylulose-5-phosphate/fructose-6-phosphate phosphoketolase
MDNQELSCLFSGYGYHPCFVDNLEDIDANLQAALEWAVKEILTIQSAARSGDPFVKPRWPMIVLRTPKGWGCPKKMHGQWIEGSFRAHQVPLPNAKSDPDELQALQEWLLSYSPKELLPEGHLCEAAEQILPLHKYKRLGQNPISWHGRKDLNVPQWKDYALSKGTEASCLKSAGAFLNEALHVNKHSLRIFSPDELVSNKLDAVFEYTSRNFQWDQYSRARGGQVVEILSEHTCQGNFSDESWSNFR